MSEMPQKRLGPIGWVSSRSRRFWGKVAAVILLVALYIASAFVLDALVEAGVIDKKAVRSLRVLYAPLRWATRGWPEQVEEFVEWYL
jgi:hypothetical protein